jgi:hypothetical protein
MKRVLRIVACAFLAGAAVVAMAQTPNPSPNPPDSGTGSRSRGRPPSSQSARDPSFANPPTDSQLRREQRRRAETRNKNSNQTGNKQTKAPPEQGKKTVSGKKPPQKTAAAKGGEARGATSVEFKIKANPFSNVMYLETATNTPVMNILATEGDEFVTRLVFLNGRRSVFDTIDVSLRYDPAVIRPLGLDDSALDGLTAEPPLARVDERRGILAYHARLATPLSVERLSPFKVAWKAVSPASVSPIKFMNDPEYPSRVLNGDQNVLLPRDEDGEPVVSDNAGLLDAAVSVVSRRGGDELEESDEGPSELSGVLLANRISEGTAEGGVRLALRPRQNSARVGEDFLVDIVYSNPRRADIDRMRVRVRFDPKVLQVEDTDTDNWITKGVNIWDGPYREDLPFDYHLRNAALNESGLIIYEMGFRQRVRIPTSGVVATIRFRAKAPVAATNIAFQLDEGESEPGTSFSFLGFNLIGVPGRRAEALTNAVVSVN